jgi:glucose/arabinose dehydrogenase
VVVLPDDDRDGLADANITFLSGLPSIQGLLFAHDALYYQDDTTIRVVPYHAGDRQPSGPSQVATTITAPQDVVHWPKVMDIAADGTIYITNGGSQADMCLSTWPTRGSIFSIGAGGSPVPVAKGFRNPIAIRCEANHNVCLAIELGLDYSSTRGGREKLVPVRAGDNWGYPCCATQGVPYARTAYQDADGGVPDCSGVAADVDSFVIGHTPFGLDFETGKWPAPWTGRVFVTLHGEAIVWWGARLVSIALDPNTGLPLPGTEVDSGATPNSLLEFATGWDDGTRSHGRPAAIAFAPDGRMFVADDNRGIVVWIAPAGLTP